jgi:hypothetical protein
MDKEQIERLEALMSEFLGYSEDVVNWYDVWSGERGTLDDRRRMKDAMVSLRRTLDAAEKLVNEL